MNSSTLDVVTGAFSYTGKYIAEKLLSLGREVRTLTNHPGNAGVFGGRIDAHPLRFDAPEQLVLSLRGAQTLFNTYWIRFSRGEVTFDRAVENTKILVRAAQEAGVRRIVHVSIANPSLESRLAYFQGKARAEEAVADSGLAYTIIRPTLVYGAEDVLINNIAWFLRKSPVFPIPGRGEYLVQPVHVEDVAEAAAAGAERPGHGVQDCAGPETYSYRQLVLLVADALGVKCKILSVPPILGVMMAQLAGCVVKDVVLTRGEVQGLMAGLLVSHDPPTGRVRFSRWLEEHRDRLGISYASELTRHYR